MKRQKLLLLEDIDNSRRKGEIVDVKSGYARNFLLPKRQAVIVDTRTMRMQERLRIERLKQAVTDKSDSEKIAKGIEGQSLEITVKVDPDGNMYGSVSAIDIVRLLEEKGHTIDRRFIRLPAALKRLGKHSIELTLKEGVKANFTLELKSDTPLPEKKKKEDAPKTEEESAPSEETPEG